ncbi:MAG: hypothetical protein K8S15_12850 [Candidatus Aegiribacteria sp.]|nr:hypothetical protein [Candidatus Aegiribacteria sp.]
MAKFHRVIILAVSLMLSLSCGDNPDAELSRGAGSIRDSLQIMIVVPAAGDLEYGIADVSDIALMDSGDYAILDYIACCIHVLDSEGGVQYQIGGRGSGPGEFRAPYPFAYLATGDFVVRDMMMENWQILGSDGSSVEYYTGSFFNTIIEIQPGKDSTIVVKQINIEITQDAPIATVQLVAINAYTGVLETIYFEHSEQMSSSQTDYADYYPLYAVDRYGNVATAILNQDSPEVEFYNSSGEYSHTIQLDMVFERTKVDSTYKISGLPVSMPVSFGDDTRTFTVEVPEKEPIISGIAFGPDNNLWARVFWSLQSERWNVFKPDGEFVRSILLDLSSNQNLSHPSLRVSRNGICGRAMWDTGEKALVIFESE